MSDTAAAILITGYSIATFGVVSSILSLWIIYKTKILHNAFGLICAVQSIVDGSVLIFNIFITFTIIAINPEAKESVPIIAIGLFLKFCNSAVIFLLLLKAINRTFVIIFPTNYYKNFSIKKTILYLIIVSLLSLIQIFLYAFSGCYLIFTSLFFGFTYKSDDCIGKTAYFVSTWTLIVILGITIFFDGITLFYLRLFRKRIIQHDKKKMKAEIRFFLQSLLTTVFYSIMIISPRILYAYATTTFFMFLTSAVNVLLFHATNEFFFIIFTVFINRSIKTISHVHVIQP